MFHQCNDSSFKIKIPHSLIRSSACCLREVLCYAICGHLMYGHQTTRL